MPEIRYYEVEQTRMVKVAANDELNALVVANRAFAEDDTPVDYTLGRPTGRVEVKQVTISRETP